MLPLVSRAHPLRDTFLGAVLGATLFAVPASAQAPDTVLLNGKIVTYDSPPAQALAVRDGRIAAIGSAAGIRATAGPSTRVIDLGGRTVIPGLTDSHIHAIRAGLTWQTEVHWIGIRSEEHTSELQSRGLISYA